MPGKQMEHLAAIYDGVKRPERLGICLDTAHLFAAGYDIRTRKGWAKPLDNIGKWVGIKEILAFHLNDSNAALVRAWIGMHTSVRGKSEQKGFVSSSMIRVSKINRVA